MSSDIINLMTSRSFDFLQGLVRYPVAILNGFQPFIIMFNHVLVLDLIKQNIEQFKTDLLIETYDSSNHY